MRSGTIYVTAATASRIRLVGDLLDTQPDALAETWLSERLDSMPELVELSKKLKKSREDIIAEAKALMPKPEPDEIP